MFSLNKLKSVCSMFGENTVWNLMNIHGWFWTVLGWVYFWVGNVYFWGDWTMFLAHIYKSAWFAGGATAFLFAVHVFKEKQR
jgi:hypothetical protein